MTNLLIVVAMVFSNTLIFLDAKMYLLHFKTERNFNVMLSNNFVKF